MTAPLAERVRPENRVVDDARAVECEISQSVPVTHLYTRDTRLCICALWSVDRPTALYAVTERSTGGVLSRRDVFVIRTTRGESGEGESGAWGERPSGEFSE